MTSIVETLSTLINDVSPDITFDPEKDMDSTLTDLGVDSLDNMSLFLEIQGTFDLDEIPDSVIDQLLTPRQIVAYLNESQSKAA